MPRTFLFLLPLSLVLAGCVTNGGWVEDPSTFDPSAAEPGSPEDVRARTAGSDELGRAAEANGLGQDATPNPETGTDVIPPPPVSGTPTAEPGPRLALRDGEAAPVEIFVLPVQDESKSYGPPLAVLRRQLAAGLVELRYSPLSLDYGDAMLSQGASEGVLDPLDALEPMQADALLQVRLVRWNADLLESRGILRAQIEVSLWRGSDPRTPALWTGRVEREVEVPARNLRTTPRAELEADCARRLVGLLLADLPPRT